jgi:membrane protease YdiL (CAAX protease family)
MASTASEGSCQASIRESRVQDLDIRCAAMGFQVRYNRLRPTEFEEGLRMDEGTFRTTEPGDERVGSGARRLLIFGVAIAILMADVAVVTFSHHLRDWADLSSGSPWNWFGKSMSIAFSCLLLSCSPWLRQNVGLRWRQAPGSARLSVGCFLVYLGCASGIGFLITPMKFAADTLMFQFFMPPVAEELQHRGILLALFERAFGQSPMSCRLRFGYAALLSSLIFGLLHGATIVDGQFQFSFLFFSTTAAWAALAALVRTRSGSLLWPMIYHGVWDGSLFLVPMIRS